MAGTETLLDGSRRESRRVLAAAIAVIAFVPATILLLGDGDTATVMLSGASVLVAAAALFLSYAGAATTRQQTVTAVRQDDLARLDAAAPTVAVRVTGLTTRPWPEPDGGQAPGPLPPDTGLRFEATVRVEVFGERPALVHLDAGPSGTFRERGLHLVTDRCGPSDFRFVGRLDASWVTRQLASDRAWDGTWACTVPLVVHDAVRTVSDALEATCSAVLFARRQDGWAWVGPTADVRDGWARRVSRAPVR